MARVLVALALSVLLGCERADQQSESDNPVAVPATQRPIEDVPHEPERPLESDTPKQAKKRTRREPTYSTEPPAESRLDNPERACCRYCSKGKACGNSCIAAWKTCHKGGGCACDL